jgi:hypothetical protein
MLGEAICSYPLSNHNQGVEGGIGGMRGLDAGALPLSAWQWSRPALGRDTAEVRGPAFGRPTGMPPKEEPGSGSAGTD